MGWHVKVLVVANETATSEVLLDALRHRAESDQVDVFLVVPAPSGARDAARKRLDAALQAMREAGLTANGVLGDADPVCAVGEVWDPRRFDEVVVSTLPGQTSKWLRFDMPHRIARLTGQPVRHVVATDMVERVHGEPPPAQESHPLGPLEVLAWHR